MDVFLVCYSVQCECLGRCTVEKYQCPWIPHYGTFHHIIPVCSGVLLQIEDIFVVMSCVPYKWKSCLFSALMVYIEWLEGYSEDLASWTKGITISILGKAENCASYSWRCISLTACEQSISILSSRFKTFWTKSFVLMIDSCHFFLEKTAFFGPFGGLRAVYVW